MATSLASGRPRSQASDPGGSLRWSVVTAAADPVVLDASSIAEVAWVDGAGRPRAAGVLPLLRQGRPVLAFTFDRAALATELAGAPIVDLLVREPRNTGTTWRPAAWRCSSRLVEDVAGDLYAAELMLQELRRYPPSRRYADSPLLCREHWWYLPRLVVDLEPLAALDPPARRERAEDALLVTVSEGGPRVSGAVAEPAKTAATWGPEPRSGPGLLFGQDASFPDLEVWHTWQHPVAVTADGLITDGPLPEPTVGPLPGIRERWRHERSFAAACRRGLAAWDS